MSRDPVGKQAIGYLLTVPDVVHDQIPFVIVGPLFYYNAYMANSFSKIPRYDIAGFVIIRLQRRPK